MPAGYQSQPARPYSSVQQALKPSSLTTKNDPALARYSLPSITSLIEVADEGTGKERSGYDGRDTKAAGQQISGRSPGRPFSVSQSDVLAYCQSGVFPAERQHYNHSHSSEINSTRELSNVPEASHRHSRAVETANTLYNGSPYSCYGAHADLSTASSVAPVFDGPPDVVFPAQRSFPASDISKSLYDEPLGQWISHSTPAWQHHHHFPNPATPYPPNQDRYICGTCNKAFSRPSSLKIHTYSHTGEKPWRCQVAGCGKTFSVRSNMKRHEKGCHGEGGCQGGENMRSSPGSDG